jgi:SAM-dependent methyltransferase
MSLVGSLRRLDRALFPDLLVLGLARETAGSASVLDVGCGQGGPMVRVPKPPRLVGLDGHAASIERLRAKALYDELICAPLAAGSIAPGAYDTVVCLDVIEHFEKPEALALIAAMESWARRKVVLATPNGFLPQRPYDDNPFQEHKCGFSVAELRGLGYRVRGTGGPKPLRGEEAVLRFWPKPLWHRISGALQPLTWAWPQAAFGLLAVKDLAP